jgi:hypothetical protein
MGRAEEILARVDAHIKEDEGWFVRPYADPDEVNVVEEPGQSRSACHEVVWADPCLAPLEAWGRIEIELHTAFITDLCRADALLIRMSYTVIRHAGQNPCEEVLCEWSPYAETAVARGPDTPSAANILVACVEVLRKYLAERVREYLHGPGAVHLLEGAQLMGELRTLESYTEPQPIDEVAQAVQLGLQATRLAQARPVETDVALEVARRAFEVLERVLEPELLSLISEIRQSRMLMAGKLERALRETRDVRRSEGIEDDNIEYELLEQAREELSVLGLVIVAADHEDAQIRGHHYDCLLDELQDNRDDYLRPIVERIMAETTTPENPT